MDLVKYIEFLRKNIRPLRNILLGILAVIVLGDLVLPRNEEHSHFFIDRIRAYWTVFAIAGCFLLLKIGKGIAHMFLSRDEDYYDK
jgi:hypothetical protein